jgi:small-conductance mechanosensitive channel
MPEFEEPAPAPVEVDPVAEAFYSGAVSRITRLMPVLALLGTVASWWRAGGAFAIGFAFGCVVAYVNFYWLKRVVNALGELTQVDRRDVARQAVVRFLMRYGVIAIAACAILSFSARGLYGMTAGLFLPAGAILCEAAYEVYVALRRGL